MMRKAAAGDHAEFDAAVSHRVHHAGPIECRLRVQDDREAEPRALAVLALNDEAVVAAEQLDEMLGVPPSEPKHVVEFLELLDADGAGELERPHVVPRHDK